MCSRLPTVRGEQADPTKDGKQLWWLLHRCRGVGSRKAAEASQRPPGNLKSWAQVFYLYQNHCLLLHDIGYYFQSPIKLARQAKNLLFIDKETGIAFLSKVAQLRMQTSQLHRSVQACSLSFHHPRLLCGLRQAGSWEEGEWPPSDLAHIPELGEGKSKSFVSCELKSQPVPPPPPPDPVHRDFTWASRLPHCPMATIPWRQGSSPIRCQVRHQHPGLLRDHPPSPSVCCLLAPWHLHLLEFLHRITQNDASVLELRGDNEYGNSQVWGYHGQTTEISRKNYRKEEKRVAELLICFAWTHETRKMNHYDYCVIKRDGF